jgi:hypothetical protein
VQSARDGDNRAEADSSMSEIDPRGVSAEWSARGRRLADIARAATIAADFPLLKVLRLSVAQFARLEGAAVAYLWHTLSHAHPARAFHPAPTLISQCANEIRALPNRTPNGVLRPHRGTFLSFNLIHQALSSIFDELGLSAHLSALQVPCNVRIVDGAPDAATEARPYASTKIHTDVWNGEPSSSVLFNIPVLGDARAVDLVFYEPRDFPASLRRSLDDYGLGDRVAAGAVEYRTPFEPGRLYLSDALALHKTVKRAPVLRLSLDLRGIARTLLPGESDDARTSKAVYVASDRWREMGTSVILGSGEPADGFERRARGESVADAPLSIAKIESP